MTDRRACGGHSARVPAALATAAVLALGTGCANVPSGGRVVAGHAADRVEQADDPYVRLIPAHPRPDWSPAQVVAGFLAASGGFDDGHKVAREYLSAGSASWNPGPRPAVTVFQNWQPPQVVQQNGDSASVQVAGDRLGRIGGDGQYSADPDTAVETFQLTRSPQGVWRITGLPDDARSGLLLTKADVDRAFRTVNLYYFAPGRPTLVPNGVFLPLVTRHDLPDQLVRALLTGPSSWLGPAVKSEFPEGTRLRGRVALDKDTATVDLSKEARGGDPDRMSAQLSWTLRQLSEIKRWKLQIEGVTVEPRPTGPLQPVRSWPQNAPDGPEAEAGQAQPAYVIGAAGSLARLAGDQPQPAGLPPNRLVRPAVSGDHQEIAGLSRGGDQVLAGALANGTAEVHTLLTRRDRRTRFTAPGFDRDGTLWTVETSQNRSWLWMRQRGRPPVRVQTWGLGGREVSAFRVARDGVRAAAIVKIDARYQVQLGRIVRGPAGPTEAGSFLPVSSELTESVDLAWRDFGTLAVLGSKNNDKSVLPYLVPVSGAAVSALGAGALGVPKTITAAPNQSVLVGTQAGTVCRQTNPNDQISEWLCSVQGSDPTYPY
ncbi:LpqB family beta-propeller domain-containing protein [Actinomadura macrotermitis]|uniref:Lipoprotein LpqB n=1 Tax=Actinomadura macrotermitis TaxID=2585200 RepID=A0A7K0C0W9_9ACTN|nr:LpqB family beta-propeller domain-containing protein [Actinomadura macrotermitis]MQY07108.1 Lipoprotein LpqB [Actinomadura macrotermitis]